MSKKNTSDTMVATKIKNKVIPCSTPERRAESPSRDSDSIGDSEGTSPVPFLCTQDGVEGDTDVVWNYYTPKAENSAKSVIKNSTPLSRKVKKPLRPKFVEKQIPKRKIVKARNFDQKTEFLKDLLELNQQLPELLAKPKTHTIENSLATGDDDNFHNSLEYSPKSGIRNTSRCLRKNVLSSKFSKIDSETAIDSDDSMNECLLKASQMVEEKLVECRPTSPKRACYETHKNFKTNMDTKIEQDSMDAILNTIKLESPVITNIKKFESPKLVNDSFDSLVGNLDDSALEQLTQMPIKSSISGQKLKPKLCEQVCKDSSPSSKYLFGRYSSMPESPTVLESNKPSTSGMVFGRYNSMPFDQNGAVSVDGDSPIRCTPDEIKRKHLQAREKLLAKRQLPFTSSQRSINSLLEDNSYNKAKGMKFQPKIPSSASTNSEKCSTVSQKSNIDIKLIIEKKRQEALIKLRRRQPKS